MRDNIRKFKKRVRTVKKSKYSLLIYILTIFVSSIWTIFTPCISYLAIPILAVYIPSRFYGENGFKKLVVAGFVGTLLITSSATLYHSNYFYTQEMTPVDSPNNILTEGGVDRIYENTEDPFNFTVLVDESRLGDNHTVHLNLSYELWTAEGSEVVKKSYEMNSIGNGTYFKEIDLDERRYFHRFAVNHTEDSMVVWEETDQAYGPMTLPFEHTLISIFVQRTPVPVLVFLFIISILWWKNKIKESKEKSTEGLKEKEEKLEDYCPKCGELMEGSDQCPECGFIRDEITKIKSKRITCTNCGKSISKEQNECPYCGEDVID